ncbi:WD40 repeat domain-containing protein, partial [Escherichia coli]
AMLWNLQGKLIRLLIGHKGPVYDARFSPDGRYIVTASFDTTAKLWDLRERGADVITLVGHKHWVTQAS